MLDSLSRMTVYISEAESTLRRIELAISSYPAPQAIEEVRSLLVSWHTLRLALGELQHLSP